MNLLHSINKDYNDQLIPMTGRRPIQESPLNKGTVLTLSRIAVNVFIYDIFSFLVNYLLFSTCTRVGVCVYIYSHTALVF